MIKVYFDESFKVIDRQVPPSIVQYSTESIEVYTKFSTAHSLVYNYIRPDGKQLNPVPMSIDRQEDGYDVWIATLTQYHTSNMPGNADTLSSVMTFLATENISGEIKNSTLIRLHISRGIEPLQVEVEPSFATDINGRIVDIEQAGYATEGYVDNEIDARNSVEKITGSTLTESEVIEFLNTSSNGIFRVETQKNGTELLFKSIVTLEDSSQALRYGRMLANGYSYEYDSDLGSWVLAAGAGGGELYPIEGPKGEPGEPVKVKGILDTLAQLYALSPTLNDAYTVLEDGHMYSWSGDSWVDLGQVIASEPKSVSISGRQVFKYLEGQAAPTESEIVLNATLHGFIEGYKWEFWDGTAWQLLSGTNLTSSYTLSYNQGEWGQNTELLIRCISGSYSDEMTIIKIYDGDDSLSGFLTNENITINADNNGENYTLAAASGRFRVYSGLTDVNAETTFNVVIPTKNGLTLTIDAAGNYSLSGSSWNTNEEYFTLRGVYSGITIEKTFTISKALKGDQGIQGTDPNYVKVLGNHYFKFLNGNAAPEVETITLVADLYGDLTTYDWEYWTGTSWVDFLGTQNTQTFDLRYDDAAWSNSELRVRCLSGILYDEITIVKLYDGTDGLDGAPGTDGSDGEDALAGYLTNENVTIPTLSDGTGYTLTGVGGVFKVFSGITDVTSSATFAVTTSTKNGLTLSIGVTGSYTLSGTSWTSDTENFELTAVYNGVTLSKRFIISKAKQGNVGDEAKLVSISGPVVFKFLEGATTPTFNSINLTAELTGGLTSYDWEYWNGTIWTDLSGTSTAQTYTLDYDNAAWGDSTSLRVRCLSETKFDEQTIIKVYDGQNGLDGSNGADGTDGVNGDNAYLHIAYATAADGVAGFSTTDSVNKTYIGTYTDNVLADSNLPSAYNWTLIKGADGANGSDGTDGTNAYIHIAYSTSSDGSAGFSTTNSTDKTYIGQYTDSTASDSTNYLDYTWTLIKGADGANGTDGNDGTSAYLHIAYADSSDGSVGFSTNISTDKTYIGQYTNNIITDSEVYTDYTWTKIVGPAGADGSDGLQFYLHIAYSTASDGSTGFSTTDPVNKTYIGTYTDTNLADSNTPSDYTWAEFKGADGVDGSDGTSVVLQGSVQSIGDLPTGTAQVGDLYVVLDSGDGYVFNGSSWDNVGQIQGPAGDPGADGLSTYVHFAYADDVNGTNFSTTPYAGAIYIGQYTDFTLADSNNYLDYNWSLFKGADGANGTDGSDGVPAYLHYAYATSSDGSTNFSTTYTGGETYVGFYTDSIEADSTNYLHYEWSLFKGSDGLDGANGEDGLNGYIHYAYSTSPDGSLGFSTTYTGNETYVGWYSDNTLADSNDYLDYEWSLFKGADGLDGEDGLNGLDAYIHYAYSTAADGSAGFSTTYTGVETHVGVYTDSTLADSNDYLDYEWSLFKGTDGVDGTDGTNGEDALNGVLTNENITIAANSDGTGYDLTGASGTFRVFSGITDVTTSAAFTVLVGTKNGLTLGINSSTGVYSASGGTWTSDNETFELQATYEGVTISKYFSISKSRQGTQGETGSEADYLLVTGEQAFKFLSGSTIPTATTITLTALLSGSLTEYNWEYWNGTAWAQASGTSTAQTYNLSYEDAMWGSNTALRLRCTSGTLYDEITIVKLYDGDAGTDGTPGTDGTDGLDGVDGMAGFLTNEAHITNALSDGTNYDLSKANGVFKIFKGTTDVTNLAAFTVSGGTQTETESIKTQNGLSLTVNRTNGTYTLNGANWTTNTEVFTLNAVYDGVLVSKIYKISKVIEGSVGEQASYVIVTGKQVFKYLKGATIPVDTVITLSAELYGGLTVYDWEYWTGTGWANLTGTQNVSTYNLAYDNTAWGSNTTLRIRCLSGLKFDEITVFKLYDGDDGADGTPGTDGTDGVNGTDGADGEDSRVGFLTNEAITLPANSNGTSYNLTGLGGTFKVYEGITDVTLSSTFSVVTATKNGLTLSIDTSGVYSLSGISWTTNTETFELQATYNGTTITKLFNITKSLRGYDGSDGPTGPGLVYKGLFSSSTTYIYDDSRRDVVIYNGSYYAKADKGTGAAIWNSSDWEAMTGFESVATDILLANDATITKGLVMGTANGDAFIRSNGMASLNSGSGFYLQDDGQFRFGNTGGNNIFWNGSLLSINGDISASSGTFGGISLNSEGVQTASTSGLTEYNDFENNSISPWTASTAVNLNPQNGEFAIISGGTGSTGTGPDGAYEGTKYLYLEASGSPYNYSEYIRYTFSSATTEEHVVSFFYHANGADAKTLKVKANNDSYGKNLPTGDINQWSKASYSVPVGATYVDVIFETGTSFTGDIAIDKLIVAKANESYFNLSDNFDFIGPVSIMNGSIGNFQVNNGELYGSHQTGLEVKLKNYEVQTTDSSIGSAALSGAGLGFLDTVGLAKGYLAFNGTDIDLRAYSGTDIKIEANNGNVEMAGKVSENGNRVYGATFTSPTWGVYTTLQYGGASRTRVDENYVRVDLSITFNLTTGVSNNHEVANFLSSFAPDRAVYGALGNYPGLDFETETTPYFRIDTDGTVHIDDTTTAEDPITISVSYFLAENE